MTRLTHLDDGGRARMVDVSEKAPSLRTALATGQLRCKGETLALVEAGSAPKGEVVRTAELAGVMAAKRTAHLIPLCHPISLTKVEVSIAVDPDLPGFQIVAEVGANGVTGVEMEALTAVSVAGLTLFDMLKSVDRSMEIGAIQVRTKTGGKSGEWNRAH